MKSLTRPMYNLSNRLPNPPARTHPIATWDNVFVAEVCLLKIHPAMPSATMVNRMKNNLCCDPIPNTAPSLRTRRKFRIRPGIAITPSCWGIGDQFGLESNCDRSRSTDWSATCLNDQDFVERSAQSPAIVTHNSTTHARAEHHAGWVIVCDCDVQISRPHPLCILPKVLREVLLRESAFPSSDIRRMFSF